MLRSGLIAPIATLLERHAINQGRQVAFSDAHGELTYAELARHTANLASHLADFGIGPGDCVAVYLPSSVSWAEAALAIARAGAIAVPISFEATESEVAYRLSDANCRLIFTRPEKRAVIEKIKLGSPITTKIIVSDAAPGDHAGSQESLAREPGRSRPRDAQEIDADAFLVYTSGTTGKAKGVLLSVRNMLWVTAACWSPILGLSANDRLLSPLPLFHSYALNLCVLSVVATGASIHLMERYSTSEATHLLATGNFTIFPAVPTIFHYLLDAARTSDAGLPGIRACVTAGAIMPAALNAEFERRFGVPLLDGYGITETSTMVTMNSDQSGRVPGSCGLPLPGLATRIVDPSLQDCGPGEEGELIVRGPSVMRGYLNKPDETAAALRNGWYHTGDLARADANGFITITGRIKELIIRGGQNIAPAEVEDVVLALDCVVDCAVAGLPHDGLGEIVGLFVIPRDANFREALVIEHCKKHLSSYKVPTSIHIVADIPRTGSGKVIRHRLRELVIS